MMKQLLYRGPAFEILHEEFAKKGRLDEQTPVRASSRIHIDAPVEKVWELLIDVPNWPTINPSFSDVRLTGGTNIDTNFDFKLNTFPIKAKFAVINPYHELHWTGASLWFKAVDLHVLEPAYDGGTQLSIAESFAGILAPLFISSDRLRVQHGKWLSAFKRTPDKRLHAGAW
jgi:hypothetical protein